MIKRISFVLAALLVSNAALAKMSADEIAFMQTTISNEQLQVNAQQVFVRKLQAEVSKKQQSVAINKGAVRAAQWTTIPIAALEMTVLAKGLIEEGYRAYQYLANGATLPGTKVNIRKQVIIASMAMAAYYASDAYEQNYVVVQTKDLDVLEGQLQKSLEILIARQNSLSSMQNLLNEQL